MSSADSSSIIEQALSSAQEGTAALRVATSESPLQALIADRYAMRSNQRVVVVVPDADASDSFSVDLSAIHSLIHADQPLRPIEIPEYSESPYQSVSPSLKVRAQRLRSLYLASQARDPAIVVASLSALLQKTIPLELFRRHILEIKPGQSIGSREALVQRLTDLGYQKVDPCEDPGTFSVRGDIIDLFPPSNERPYRIELFDDVIEQIREYDPSTQRALKSDAALKQARISPAREVLNSAEERALTKERLKDFCDSTGFSRKLRDPIAETIDLGYFDEFHEFLASFAYPAPSTTARFLKDAGFEFLWVDELGGLQNHEAKLESLRGDWARFLEEPDRVLPSPDLWISAQASDIEMIKDSTRVFVDALRLANLAIETEEGEEPEERRTFHPKAQRLKFGVQIADGAGGANLETFKERIRDWSARHFEVALFAKTSTQLDRLRFLFKDVASDRLKMIEGELSSSLISEDEKLVLISDDDLFGSKKSPRKQGKETAAKEWSGLKNLQDLEPGNAIVHVAHGIGKYIGLIRLKTTEGEQEYIQIEYAGADKLYLPVYRLNLIQKYAGGAENAILDKLGGQSFEKAKERARESVRKLAIDLVKLYAKRSLQKGQRFESDPSILAEFESKFPFDETEDQLKAIRDCYRDLASGRVMDRLVCGDVGYGKTEVAIRAAFAAVNAGRQVAVLVPTTILCHQHEASFKARLKDYPIAVESLSRFKAAKEQKEILSRLADGKVDIVVGTHRLVSKDAKFKNLGLVIIDEEHRFGVEHKEKLKALKVNTHVLTMTATPIPRTLHMSMSGLRDISLIATPPVDRLPIRTYVSRFDEELIRKAIRFELGRGGQVFFVHNRVQSIFEIAAQIREWVPEAKITVAHAQMKDSELEAKMLEFYGKETNVLISTTIIESGLDIPSANTMIINQADRFGLAQLYQLRGRVGRSNQRAYAYLLVPNTTALTEDAKKRLDAIQRFVDLGSGFSIASHDLEIRGGGNLLGAEQSGHIAAVGFDLYAQLLEEAIQEIKGAPEESGQEPEPEIKVPNPCFLDESYVPDVHQRLSLYRRLSSSSDSREVHSIEEEMLERYGPLPEPGRNLIWLIQLKNLLKRYRFDSLVQGPEKVVLTPSKNCRADTAKVVGLISKDPSVYSLTPESRWIVRMKTTELKELFFKIEQLLQRVEAVESRNSR